MEGMGYAQRYPAMLCFPSPWLQGFSQRSHQVKREFATSKEIQKEYKIKNNRYPKRSWKAFSHPATAIAAVLSPHSFARIKQKEKIRGLQHP